MDKDGSWWCYEAEPHRHDSGWYENEVGRSIRINGYSAIADMVDWQQSLVKLESMVTGTHR